MNVASGGLQAMTFFLGPMSLHAAVTSDSVVKQVLTVSTEFTPAVNTSVLVYECMVVWCFVDIYKNTLSLIIGSLPPLGDRNALLSVGTEDDDRTTSATASF